VNHGGSLVVAKVVFADKRLLPAEGGVVGELEAELCGGAQSGQKHVLQIEIGRAKGAAVENGDQARAEHVAGTRKEPINETCR
jgi:hypothetical protein